MNCNAIVGNGGRSIIDDSWTISAEMVDEDVLKELRDLARNGSVTASLFLKGYYKDKDDGQVYKYACYAALAGDEASVSEISASGRVIPEGFPDDYLESEYDDDMVIDKIEPHGAATYLFGHFTDDDIGPHGRNDGYINPDDAGYHIILCAYEKDIPDDDGGQDQAATSSLADESSCDGYRLALYRYLGIDTERDGIRSLRELLEMAETGDERAARALMYLTGYQPESYRLRLPDYSDDDIREIDAVYGHIEHFPRRYYHGVADRGLLEDSTEWEILSIITGIDSYGLTDIVERTNAEGGYEDDILYTRTDDQSEEGEPTLVFKPSGYSMGWYKYAWNSPEQSENLSIGEILRIWRLCIEHIMWGREIPNGTTREILGLPIDTVIVPDDLRERFDRVISEAMCAIPGLVSVIHYSTFRKDTDGSAEARAKEILAGTDRSV